MEVVHGMTGKSEDKLQERAEWWMEEGQDEYVWRAFIVKRKEMLMRR